MQLQLLLPLLAAQHAAALLIPNLDNFHLDELFSVAVPQIAVEKPVKNIISEPSRQSPVSAPVSANAIPNKYIVVLKEGISEEEIAKHMEWATKALREAISHEASQLLSFLIDAFNGYLGYMPPAFVEFLKKLPVVEFVEQDSVMHVNEFDVQKDAPWGLSRVSQRTSTSTDYFYDTDGGKGVTAYIIDTGIKTEHPDFEGRAVWGDAIAFPNLKVDAHGHGSHVAGTIGSKTYGIAKNVDLVAVGVMNLLGSGTTSDIIKGIEFAANDHKSKVAAKQKGYKGATVNMLIGGGASDALDLAANAGTKAGLHISVAAGNENQDTCDVSPARASGPITVGATDSGDAKASFSNWGLCVDIQAPGVDILSVGIWQDTAVMSGTSMAAPHITGLLSYYLSLQPEFGSEFDAGIVTPADLKQRLIRFGTKGIVTGLDKASPNVLAFNGAGGNITDFWK